MARIRSIKPEFYRSEKLQDLELENPGAYPMLVFAALYGHCDKQGVFEWRPRIMALDILPFLWEGSNGEALGKTLGILAENKLILRLFFEGKEYGYMPAFAEDQRINGKEAQEPSKFPEVSEMLRINNVGSNGEATGKQSRRQEGKGREGKGRERKISSNNPPLYPPLRRRRVRRLKRVRLWRKQRSGAASRRMMRKSAACSPTRIWPGSGRCASRITGKERRRRTRCR